MPRIRLLLAWLLMAAIPLQGWAAASMLCGMGAPAKVQSHTGGGHADPAASAHGRHDHASHDHASRGPALETRFQAQADAAAGDAGTPSPEAGHKCGVCAFCCHGTAIADTAQVTPAVSVPPARLTEPFVLIHARPSQVPERPPRA